MRLSKQELKKKFFDFRDFSFRDKKMEKVVKCELYDNY